MWYESSFSGQDLRRAWLIRLNRCMHPVPFVALVALLFTGMQRRLRAIEWLVIGVYLFCLLPYVAVSYYDRYALPLLGVKALLVVWAADRLLALLPRRRRELLAQPAAAPAHAPGKAPCSQAASYVGSPCSI